MPDRAIIALLPAAMVGFICGMIVSALQVETGGSRIIGIVGAIVVAAAALSSVVGVGSDTGEKGIVALLRAGCAVAVFAGIYLFILSLMRDGEPGKALIFLVAAGLFAILLTRLRVRDRGELRADA